MESRDDWSSVSDSSNIDTSLASSNEQEKIEALLEEIKRNQILLIQHDLLLSSIKVAVNDPNLEESVQDTINRVLVHGAFEKSGLPESFFEEQTMKRNAAARLSYDESVPLKEIVEKFVEEKCKDLIDKFNGLEIEPTDTDVNPHDVKIKLYLECETELQKAQNLLSEEQLLFSSLAELRLKSLEDLQESAQHLTSENSLLALKSKVQALTHFRDMLKEERGVADGLSKMAAVWRCKLEESKSALQRAQIQVAEYRQLELDLRYAALLKEYLHVVEQTSNVQTALGKLS